MLKIIIDGEPQGKARPRMNTHTKRTYTPAKTRAYEEHIKMCYILQGQGKNYGESALRVALYMYYKIPKSDSKATKQNKLNNKIRPTKKPDCDNVAKVILDALNGVAYKDDSQVVELECNKYYSEDPRVEILINEV